MARRLPQRATVKTQAAPSRAKHGVAVNYLFIGHLLQSTRRHGIMPFLWIDDHNSDRRKPEPAISRPVTGWLAFRRFLREHAIRFTIWHRVDSVRPTVGNPIKPRFTLKSRD